MATSETKEIPAINRCIHVAMRNLAYGLFFLFMVYFSILGGGLNKIHQLSGEEGVNSLIDEGHFQQFLEGGAETLLTASLIMYLLISAAEISKIIKANRSELT